MDLWRNGNCAPVGGSSGPVTVRGEGEGEDGGVEDDLGDDLVI